MQPAARHILMSSLINSSTLSTVLATLSKILAFLSFHNLQCIRIAIVSKFLRNGFGIAALAFSHQSSVVPKCSLGTWILAPVQVLKLHQSYCVNLQFTNKCEQFSGSCAQRGQMPLDGQPLRSRLSAVRHFRWTANHIKNLHLGGALDFHIGLEQANRVLPMKKS